MHQPRRHLKTSYMCFLYGKRQLVEKKSEANSRGAVGAPLGECYQAPHEMRFWHTNSV